MGSQRQAEDKRLVSSDAGQMVGLQWDRAEIEQAPTAWERQDFNQRYGLAVRFKLVTDYC